VHFGGSGWISAFSGYLARNEGMLYLSGYLFILPHFLEDICVSIIRTGAL